MRWRLTVVFLLGVCGTLAVTHLASARTAGEARYDGTFPTATSQTTAVTLASSRSAADFGGPVVLSGQVFPAQGGVAVELWGKFFNTAWRLLTTTTTTSNGTFTLTPKTFIKTIYQARLPQAPPAASKVVTVNARAWMRMNRDESGRYYVPVQTANFNLSGRFVLIQRSMGSGRWVTLRRATLRRMHRSSTSQFRTTPFSLSLPGGRSHLRAYLPRAQAAPAYLPSVSRTLTVTR
jgi:hypothetical protein